MDKLISVVVPIYNVEAYLERCVDSILNQTYKNLEILLVDDGSPDGCPRICDEYALKDPRIRVTHKANGGLSDARNVGIDAATGDFIGFIDSDDYIHPRMFEILCALLEETDSDIAMCGMQKVSGNPPMANDDSFPEIKILSNLQALDMLFGHLCGEAVVACNKLYKRTLFESIRYPVGKLHEDEFVTYRLLHKSSRVVFTQERLYYYFIRHGSITQSSFNPAKLAVLDGLAERTTFFFAHSLTELAKKSAISHIATMRIYYFRAKKSGLDPVYFRTLKQRHREELKKFSLYGWMPFKARFKEYLFRFSPFLSHAIHTLHAYLRHIASKLKSGGDKNANQIR